MPGAEPIQLPKDANPGQKLPAGKKPGSVQAVNPYLTPTSSSDDSKSPF